MMHIYEINLGPSETKKLNLTDPYSYHRLAYSLAPYVQHGRPVLFEVLEASGSLKKLVVATPFEIEKPKLADFDYQHRVIQEGFFRHDKYFFRVALKPVKRKQKTEYPIRGKEELRNWFSSMSQKWGFHVEEQTLAIQTEHSLRFKARGGNEVVANKAVFSGVLEVRDRGLFIQKVKEGLGRGKAFGFGLVHLQPLI